VLGRPPDFNMAADPSLHEDTVTPSHCHDGLALRTRRCLGGGISNGESTWLWTASTTSQLHG